LQSENQKWGADNKWLADTLGCLCKGWSFLPMSEASGSPTTPYKPRFSVGLAEFGYNPFGHVVSS
ncbi:MAG: hypothetical protein ACFB8W_17315, partial [Elainellaceae cyanobacterium]